MGLESTIVNHPEKFKIDAMLLAGISLRTIAASVSPPVSFHTIGRYNHARRIIEAIDEKLKPKANPNIIRGLGAAKMPETHGTISLLSAPLRAQVNHLGERMERALDRAETAVKTVELPDGTLVAAGDDLKILAPLFRERTNNLRMLGELTGELTQSSAPNLSIVIVSNQAEQLPAAPYNMEEATMPAHLQTIDIGP